MARQFAAALVLCVFVHLAAQTGDGPVRAAARKASPFGIHGPTYSHWLVEQRPHLWLEGEAHLNVLVGTETGWARQDFWWGLCEPERDRFVWEDFDRAVAAYEQHGLNLMAILCYASAWSGDGAPQTDDERERFANYVFHIVDRYKGRVAAWEIWNEPNIMPFWMPRPDPELYAKLLQAAYTAAKKADPNCIIVGGALAGPDHEFLRGMYAAGVKGHFDVFSYHNYGQQMELETEWPAVEKLRAVMAEFGDTDKPIWHTETGFFTGPVGLSDVEQAARIVRYSVGLLALGIERTFQLTLADWTDDPKHADLSVYRGLTHADYRLKPSYAAYRTMCQRLGDKRCVATLRPAPGVSGFLFEGGGLTVLVLWRPQAAAAPADLDLGVPVVLVQQLGGDWQVLRNADGRYTLPVGWDPVYVLNPGPPVMNQRHVTWPNPVRSEIPREADAVLTAQVTNSTAGPLVLRVSPGGRMALAHGSREIPAGATQSVEVRIDAARLDVGRHEFAWELFDPSAATPFAQGHRLVEVLSPLSLAFAPLRQLRADAPALPVLVTYTGSQPVGGTLGLRIGGEPSGARQEVALTAGAPQPVNLPLDLARLGTGQAVALGVDCAAAGLKLAVEARRSLLACPAAPAAAAVDGKLDEWAGREPQLRPELLRWEYVNARETPPPEDLVVSGWVAWDARGLWIALDVQDDQQTFPQSEAVWNWDSLQVALDLGSDGQPGDAYDGNDLEIELGHRADQAPWCFLGACPPGWPREALSAKLVGAVLPDPATGKVAYELFVPAELIASVAPLTPDTVLGFSLLVNDNDGGGRAGWLELTPGIGLGKRPAEFAWLWLR